MNENQLEPDIQPEPPKPFAGRDDIFARIQQYLVDPSDRHALLIIGRDAMGKSHILQHYVEVVDNSVIPCYLPLTDVTFSSENAWLTHLIEQTNIALSYSNFTISRLPQITDTEAITRQWITSEYLPEVNKLIRSHRRLVWLMDDAEQLLDVIQSKKLPDDTLSFLYEVLQTHLQLGIVLTLNEDNESRSSQLAPLVSTSLFHRLHPLSLDETSTLLEQFGLTVEPSAIEQIFVLTDGHPLIVQYMGDELQSIRHMTITEAHVEDMTNEVYQQSYDTYRNIWQKSLSQTERLILTAISGLLYDDPLIDLNAQRVESWLLETDHPLDKTAVNAAIRGLDFRDLIAGSISNISIRGELFQRWLIEHARMDEVNPTVAKSNAVDDSLVLSRNGLLIIISIIIFTIMIVALLQQSNQSTSLPLQPTVTLEQ